MVAALLPVLAGVGLAGAVPLATGSVSTTTVTAPGVSGDRALLTDVALAPVDASAGTATFGFVGPGVPAVTVQRIPGPAILSPIGEPVAVAGNALLSVRMPETSAIDMGTCPAVAAPPVGPGQALVVVGFTCRTATPGPWPAVTSDRAVAAPVGDAGRLTAALGELLGGPNAAEVASGRSSQLSAATAGTLASVTIGADLVADVDFTAALVAALPAPDGDQLVRELDRTVGQVVTLTGARYRLGGDCAAFAAWAGLASCERTAVDLGSAGFASTYPGPDRVVPPAGGAGPIAEAVLTEDFEGQMGWVIGVTVPAGQDVQATAALDAAGAQLVITVRLVPAPAAAPPPLAPRFTG